MTIGEKISKRRTELGMSQVELAKMIGTNKSAVWKYENEVVTKIPMDRLVLIANALLVTPEYLMGWDEEQPANEYDEYIEEIRTNPGMRTLFDTCKGASKEDIERAVAIIKALKGDK